MSNFISKIRLASTSAQLSTRYLIFSLKIPRPDLPIYSDHATTVELSNGGQALRGFKSLSLTWNAGTLDWKAAARLREIIEEALDSADNLMYATINRAWNWAGEGQDWIDVKGRPVIPLASSVPLSEGTVASAFTLTINALEIINDPAVF